MDFNAFFRSEKLFLIAGPCVIESEKSALDHAEKLKIITAKLDVPFIYKSSYTKANRTAYDSFTGVGLERGLGILAKVKKEFDIPVLSDVHEVAQAQVAGEVLDVIQIPAFLARQSELLTTAGLTGKVVNIKKGQMLTAEEMHHAAEKVRVVGNTRILLTERGTSFGYDLIVDYRNIAIMKQAGYPIVFDGSHSVQKKAGNKTTGGQRQFIPLLTAAAIAAGVDGLFLECHNDPSSAKSDSATQYPLSDLSDFLKRMLDIYAASR